uniref:Uncharacterized protein n=1 Tax=Anguilla anguilla TaxID=7936 RepID=A0A0E9TI27_ANGAN
MQYAKRTVVVWSPFGTQTMTPVLSSRSGANRP